jgi:hypothetical protein
MRRRRRRIRRAATAAAAGALAGACALAGGAAAADSLRHYRIEIRAAAETAYTGHCLVEGVDGRDRLELTGQGARAVAVEGTGLSCTLTPDRGAPGGVQLRITARGPGSSVNSSSSSSGPGSTIRVVLR